MQNKERHNTTPHTPHTTSHTKQHTITPHTTQQTTQLARTTPARPVSPTHAAEALRLLERRDTFFRAPP
jgi:hypothetical protein